MADIHDLVRTDFKAVDKRDGIHSVMGWVKGDSDKRPIVTDDERPFGIVNDRALAGRRLDHHAKVEGYTLPTRALAPRATIREALQTMGEFRASYLPVEENGRAAGFVTTLDLHREIGLDRTAGQICVPVVTMKEGQTMGDALHLFRQEYVDFLPVYDAQGRLRRVLPRRKMHQMEANSGNMRGRKDAGGDKVSFLDDLIDTYCDDARTLPSGAGGDEVLRMLDDWGHVCVVDAAGRLQGIVTAETLTRQTGHAKSGLVRRG